jgi:hypothetical protein
MLGRSAPYPLMLSLLCISVRPFCCALLQLLLFVLVVVAAAARRSAVERRCSLCRGSWLQPLLLVVVAASDVGHRLSTLWVSSSAAVTIGDVGQQHPDNEAKRLQMAPRNSVTKTSSNV